MNRVVRYLTSYSSWSCLQDQKFIISTVCSADDFGSWELGCSMNTTWNHQITENADLCKSQNKKIQNTKPEKSSQKCCFCCQWNLNLQIKSRQTYYLSACVKERAWMHQCAAAGCQWDSCWKDELGSTSWLKISMQSKFPLLFSISATLLSFYPSFTSIFRMWI